MQSTTARTIAGGGHQDFLRVRHLRIDGTNREIGRALAEAAYGAHGMAAFPPPAGDPAVHRARQRWIAENHPILAERMIGVADAFGLDASGATHDLDWVGTFDVPAGCSVVFYPGSGTKDGHGVLSRNFDFPTATFTQMVGLPPIAGERPLAADPWVIELHPDHGYVSVSIGIMDVLGAMDGINEAGLTVALLADNETPDAEPTGGPGVGLAEQQIVRYLLDTCASVDEAKEALLLAKQYYFFAPCHFLVADRSGRSFVWEHSPRRNREHIIEADPTASGRLVCTNHLLHRYASADELPDDSGPIGTAAMTYSRWRTLDGLTADGAVVDRDDIRRHSEAVRFTAPIEEARTFWHAQYDVDDASVDVSFFLHDHDGESVYSDPIRFAAT